MKKILIVLSVLGIVLVLGVSISFATPYISGNLGLVLVSDSDVKDDFGDEAEISLDVGYGLSAAVGNAYENGARAEVEFGYRTNDIDDISVSGYRSASIDGDVSAMSLMANGFYDFTPNGKLSPFIGGGVGIAYVEGDIDYLGSANDYVFAYQASVGVAIIVTQSTKFDVQYRFFGTDDPDFDGLEAEYTTHNLMIGFRQSF
jgi:opacity protein-like surface antigen